MQALRQFVWHMHSGAQLRISALPTALTQVQQQLHTLELNLLAYEQPPAWLPHMRALHRLSISYEDGAGPRAAEGLQLHLPPALQSASLDLGGRYASSMALELHSGAPLARLTRLDLAGLSSLRLQISGQPPFPALQELLLEQASCSIDLGQMPALERLQLDDSSHENLTAASPLPSLTRLCLAGDHEYETLGDLALPALPLMTRLAEVEVSAWMDVYINLSGLTSLTSLRCKNAQSLKLVGAEAVPGITRL